MIEFYPKTSQLRSKTDLSNLHKSLTNEDQHLINGLVIPWSGRDYQKRLKQEIKNKQYLKRFETFQPLFQHSCSSKQNSLRKRIHTVNIEMHNLNYGTSSKCHWNTILPKKLSHKIFSKDLNLSEKLKQMSYQRRESQMLELHQYLSSHRKLNKKKKYCNTNRSQRLTSEAIQDKLTKLKEENDKISKKNDQQNYLFFFEVKHSKKVSNREKMITKIRNLEKGKAEKSLIINNY